MLCVSDLRTSGALARPTAEGNKISSEKAKNACRKSKNMYEWGQFFHLSYFSDTLDQNGLWKSRLC
jgi:hypothetical protein